MSRQDKVTTERHAKTLRELIKRPENSVCADCKKNDPRWASWNIGVFVCIRCSGIHRSMGTHISKVKSVDLDVWTPEQMKSIQQWGNTRANLYWEAHLKPGHIPPDHKIESFIRSKYESRRWAREGPPPPDPSVLETSQPVPQPEPETSSQQAASQSTSEIKTTATGRARTLLSTSRSKPTASPPSIIAPSTTTSTTVPLPPTTNQSDLFSLDFSAPAPTPTATSVPTAKKDVKNDILSLFSSASSVAQTSQQALPSASTPSSFVGHGGTGMWGVQSGWNPAPAATTAGNPWAAFANVPAAPPPQTHAGRGGSSQTVWTTSSNAASPTVEGGNIWDVSSATSGNAANGSSPSPFDDLLGAPNLVPAKKDDAFGDLWGSFK